VWSGEETSAASKFEFKFLSVDDVPRARKTISTVIEDSTHGTSIALNGSDIDSKYVAFVITELPRMGKLFAVTGQAISTPFSEFEVRAFAELRLRPSSPPGSVQRMAGAHAGAAHVRLESEECKFVLAIGPESEEAAVPIQHASQLERREGRMWLPAVASASDPWTAEHR
jgi:hypothetical protein